MKIRYQPTNLYETPIAERDNRYRAWLMDFSYAAVRLTGTNPIYDLALAKPARRWFLKGLSPYDAVKQRQAWHSRGHVAVVVLPDTCPACKRPNSTKGWQYCGKCRAA